MGSLKVKKSHGFPIRIANRRLFIGSSTFGTYVAGLNPVTPTIDFRVRSW
jgi:hypothetical protein